MYQQVWNPLDDQPHEQMIQRKADGAFIPFDPGNRDYQEYKRWLDEGNEPDPAERPQLPEPEDESGVDMFGTITEAIEDIQHRLDTLESNNETLRILTRQVATLSEAAQVELMPELSDVIKERPKKVED